MRLAISFSGGKDSLVVLHRLLQKDPSLPVVFVDTTISLPENLEYVKDLADEWGFDLKIYRPPKDFFKVLLEKRIWPRKNTRWCYTYLKMKAFQKALWELGLDGFYTGLRKEESSRRKDRPIRYWNVKARYWLVNPIIDWSKEQVEAYIRKHQLPINPCYKLYGTTGCWYCPFLTKQKVVRIALRHPELMEKLIPYEEILEPAFYFNGKPYSVKEILAQTPLLIKGG